jgi:ElaB/YqjD/DUF883 family membrane-anchored ribosome-binding protein
MEPLILQETRSQEDIMTNTPMKQQLVDELRAVLVQAENLLDTTPDGGDERFKVARQKLSESVDSLQDRWSDLQDTASRAAWASGRVIKEHPYESAGTGVALLGIAVSAVWLWQRSR